MDYRPCGCRFNSWLFITHFFSPWISASLLTGLMFFLILGVLGVCVISVHRSAEMLNPSCPALFLALHHFQTNNRICTSNTEKNAQQRNTVYLMTTGQTVGWYVDYFWIYMTHLHCGITSNESQKQTPSPSHRFFFFFGKHKAGCDINACNA